MERQVMKQGPSTLVVSLPSAWAKKQGVRKGDRLHIEESGKALLLSLQPRKDQSKIVVNVAKTLPMTHRIIGALYRAGYDEMEVKYSNGEEAAAILEAAHVMTGHAVIRHEKNIIVIKQLAVADEDSFPAVLRKCFHVLLDMAQDTVDALQRNDKELLQAVIVKDSTMAIFVDYSRRFLLSKAAPQHNAELFHIAEQLEKIADRFKYICRLYSKKKPHALVIKFLQELVPFVRRLEYLVYDFSLENLVAFGKERKRLLLQLENTSQLHAPDSTALFHGASILSATFDLNGPILTLAFRKDNQNPFE